MCYSAFIIIILYAALCSHLFPLMFSYNIQHLVLVYPWKLRLYNLKMRGSSCCMYVLFVLMFGKRIEHFQLWDNLNRSYFCGYEQLRYDFSVLLLQKARKQL